MKSQNTLVVLGLLAIIGMSLAQTTTGTTNTTTATPATASEPVATPGFVSFSPKTVGENLGSIIKVFIITATVLLFWDALKRFGGNRLFNHGVFYISRQIWWVYGMAVMWMLGGTDPMIGGYRDFLHNIWGELFSEVYDCYFGSTWFKFWTQSLKINDVTLDTSELLENSCFIEFIVLILFRILEVATMGGRKNGSAIGNLFGTFRRIASVYLCMYLWQYSLRFYSWLHAVVLLGATGTGHFNVVLSYILAIYAQLEMLGFIFELFSASANTDNKSANYIQTENPAASNNNQNIKSFDSFIDEVTFAYVRKEVAAKNKGVKLYNTIFFFRWAVYSFMCTIWYEDTRTMYSIFLGTSFLMYIYTIYVWIAGGFHKPAGFLITMSEMCIFIRHITGFALFVDWRGMNGFGPGHVDFWSHFGFWGYIIGLFIEFILVFEPMFRAGKPAPAPAPAPAKMIAPPIVNDDELFNKVQTHKSLKQGTKDEQRMQTPGRVE
jgi:hypothetical protein